MLCGVLTSIHRTWLWGNFADSLSVCVLIKDYHSNMLLITFY